jgi:hypothetical protein
MKIFMHLNYSVQVQRNLCWTHQVQKVPLYVSDEISNGKIEPENTGVSHPTSGKSCGGTSDELQNRYTDMQDAECQTVLTGELLAGPAGLEKVRDIGSQTTGTGDVISLNLFCDDLCKSNVELPNSACEPLSGGLYNHITLKDIENHVNIKGNITYLF